jgi:hypothetical protein
MVRMNDNALRTLEARLREQIAASCAADVIPGFVVGLADRCGTLFDPGEQLSYSNGGPGHPGRSETRPVRNPAIARPAQQSKPGASSPAWDRLARLLQG